MDECLTRCCVDISGRPWLVWNVFLPNVSIKDIETEIFREFFQSFSQSAENFDVTCRKHLWSKYTSYYRNHASNLLQHT